MQSKPITLGNVADGSGHAPSTRQETIKGFAPSYIRLCRGQARRLTGSLDPQPGDWILREDGELELAADPPRAMAESEVVVPRLDRVIQLLRAEAPSIVIDCYPADYACMVFDEHGRSLANFVSRNPEEAALRALLFVQSERAANEPGA